MKPFIHNDFLLHNDAGRELYAHVSGLPVVDYHNHQNPLHLAGNNSFENIASLWVTGDPYKHRAMRINGIAEDGITGKSPDKEKYINWVKTFPKTIGNPLFHWTCLELNRIFGIDEMLSEKNADHIWEYCNGKLNEKGFRAMELLRRYNVETACTSDDLTDDLALHQKATALGMGIKILPSLRSDAILSFEAISFRSWLKKLTGDEIKSLVDYKAAIIQKLDAFGAAGCKLADHSLDAGFVFVTPDEADAEKQFARVMGNEILPEHDLLNLKSFMLVFLGKEYARRNWKMQLHIGAHRYTSSRLRNLAGPAGGYGCIGKTCDIGSLAGFLDALEKQDLLPGVILYTLNPADNEAFASLTGSYAYDGIAGKIQFGPAWWYNDHYEGIRQQLITLSSYGLMSHFVGMTTDSRSLLSFSRHEYFRRVVCNLIGEWVEAGMLPDDEGLLNGLVADISYNNSKRMIEGQ